MSISSQKGRAFELLVAKMIRSKLNARVSRDSRSGAGFNKADMSDFYNEIPLHIECKDQETVKIKEWFQQAADSATTFHAPTVVFHTESEILATLRFTDVLNLLVEIADLKAELADLRLPAVAPTQPEIIGEQQAANRRIIKEAKKNPVTYGSARPANERVKNQPQYCRAGHIADQFGYCEQKDCKFRRGYKPPKGKKK